MGRGAIKPQGFDALMYQGRPVVGDDSASEQLFYIPPARLAQFLARLLHMIRLFSWYSPYFEKRGYAWKWEPMLKRWYQVTVWNERKAIQYIKANKILRRPLHDATGATVPHDSAGQSARTAARYQTKEQRAWALLKKVAERLKRKALIDTWVAEEAELPEYKVEDLEQ